MENRFCTKEEYESLKNIFSELNYSRIPNDWVPINKMKGGKRKKYGGSRRANSSPPELADSINKARDVINGLSKDEKTAILKELETEHKKNLKNANYSELFDAILKERGVNYWQVAYTFAAIYAMLLVTPAVSCIGSWLLNQIGLGYALPEISRTIDIFSKQKKQLIMAFLESLQLSFSLLSTEPSEAVAGLAIPFFAAVGLEKQANMGEKFMDVFFKIAASMPKEGIRTVGLNGFSIIKNLLKKSNGIEVAKELNIASSVVASNSSIGDILSEAEDEIEEILSEPLDKKLEKTSNNIVEDEVSSSVPVQKGGKKTLKKKKKLRGSIKTNKNKRKKQKKKSKKNVKKKKCSKYR